MRNLDAPVSTDFANCEAVGLKGVSGECGSFEYFRFELSLVWQIQRTSGQRLYRFCTVWDKRAFRLIL